MSVYKTEKGWRVENDKRTVKSKQEAIKRLRAIKSKRKREK